MQDKKKLDLKAEVLQIHKHFTEHTPVIHKCSNCVLGQTLKGGGEEEQMLID